MVGALRLNIQKASQNVQAQKSDNFQFVKKAFLQQPLQFIPIKTLMQRLRAEKKTELT